LGYVLKPPEMRVPDAAWPPARQTVTRVTLNVVSLHHLPTRGEQRPWTTSGKHSGCHNFTTLSGGVSVPPKASAAAVSSPSIQLELHAIGGFCCVSEHVHPDKFQVDTKFRTRPVDGNGLVAEFGEVAHCLAAEPWQTILRVVVLDGEHEAAYETAVLGALRPGYRCFQLRNMKTGTRISLCSLLVYIEFGEAQNLWAKEDVLRELLERQQGINEEQEVQIRDQRKRIEDLEAALQAPRPLQPPELVGQFSATVPTGAPSPLEPRLLRTLDGWCSKARSLRATGPEPQDGGLVSASPTPRGVRTTSDAVQSEPAQQAAAPGSTHPSAEAEADGRPGGSPEPDVATQLTLPPVGDVPHTPDAEAGPSPQQLDHGHEQSTTQATSSSSTAIWALRV